MHRTFVRTLAFIGIAALAACQGAAGGGMMPSQTGGFAETGARGDGEIPLLRAGAVNRVCPDEHMPGRMRCFALERSDLRANDLNPNASHEGYGPADLLSAYNIQQGKPTKIAIVDAYGYPQASTDLAAYRTYYKLGQCTVANG
ncbi:MAG TPA: hypothetical protein VN936_02005, partial [Candidatus Acidoferrum sp.]|nr:hypothetical protein [Candidatus Acidoferrum sp.]